MNAADVENMTDDERLELAKQFATDIRNGLTAELHADAYTSRSDVPVKAATYREVLLHRFSDLSDVALTLYSSQSMVPAFVMTRAAVETTASVYRLQQKSEEFLNARDVKAYDEFLMKGLVGSRDGSTQHETHNILTAVDHLDREFGGMRRMYDVLCEYTHPNFAGVMGSYSKRDTTGRFYRLGKAWAPPNPGMGLAPLIGCLSIFAHYYNAAGETITRINEHLDSAADPDAGLHTKPA